MPLYTDYPPQWGNIPAPGHAPVLLSRQHSYAHRSPTLIVSLLLLIGLVIIGAGATLLVAGRFPFQRTPSPIRLSGGFTMTVPTVVRFHPTLRPDFQRGIVTPVWSATGYSDAQWTGDAAALLDQAGASWVEMPVLLTFNQSKAMAVTGQFALTGAATSLASTEAGIRYANALGLHIFLVPLVNIANIQSGWVGALSLSTVAAQRAWFDAYSAVWLPYVALAQRTGVEQLAIATEWSKLSYVAPVTLWETLIAQVASRYSGHVTYDMNWGEAQPTPSGPFPTWMSDPRLYALGISEYKPLLSYAGTIAPASIEGQWAAHIRPMLDGVALHTGKHVLLSEVGYRPTADLFYESWRGTNTTSSPVDIGEQQAAINATLQNTLGSDTGVIGTYFWGWRNAGLFSLVGTPAVATIAQWYE